MNKKKVLSLMAASMLTVGMVFVGGCGNQTASTNTAKMKVVTTVYPVYDVAKAVGGDKIDLTMLVAPGAEPHDWEPTAQDMKAIGTAKIFMYNGLGLEPVEKLLAKDVIKDAKPVELPTASGIKPLMFKGEDVEDLQKNQDMEDPHVWLDPVNMIKETEYTAKLFSEQDPANKEYYEKNAKDYIAQLEEINKELKAWRANADINTLVVSHLAFGYLAHQYNLTQEGIMGVAPDAEPTPERMAEIVSFVKDHHVHAIFSEELVNPKLAQAIAKETGATVYMLNPIEGLTKEEMDKGDNYVTLMKENIATLKKAFPAK